MLNIEKLTRFLRGWKLAKALKRIKNRIIQLIRAHITQQQQETDLIRDQEQERHEARRRSAREKERSKDKDGGVKKSSREEQLWKLRSVNMKERIRERKHNAMKRWTMTATSGGAFRGR